MRLEATNKNLISETLIRAWILRVDEYEAIKNKTSTKFKTVKEFCEHYEMSRQNFLKVYNRFIASGRNPEALLPQKRGAKTNPRQISPEVEKRIIEFRRQGYNKNLIAKLIAEEELGKVSPSTVYNICKKHGLNRLTEKEREEKKRIISEKAGELAHGDLHELPKGIVLSEPTQKFYILGIIDGCTRTVWLVLVRNKKAITVTFAMLKALGVLNLEYGITFKALLTDNGSEFGSGRFAKNKDSHPFELLLKELDIKHRYTRPYRPQTNGKIERFWRILEDEILSGATFETAEDLEDTLRGYSLYFNEWRPHGALNGQTPNECLKMTAN